MSTVVHLILGEFVRSHPNKIQVETFGVMFIWLENRQVCGSRETFTRAEKRRNLKRQTEVMPCGAIPCCWCCCCCCCCFCFCLGLWVPNDIPSSVYSFWQSQHEQADQWGGYNQNRGLHQDKTCQVVQGWCSYLWSSFISSMPSFSYFPIHSVFNSCIQYGELINLSWHLLKTVQSMGQV